MELLFPLLILLLFIPIFLSGRRQKRQMQQMQQMQAALDAGDVIVTTSGLRGTIVDASYEDTLDIEIADGVVTTWVRSAVREKVVDPAPTEEAPVEESPAPATTPAAATEPEESTAVPLEKSPLEKSPLEKSPLEKSPLEKSPLEKSTVEKDESTNGTARS